MHTSYFFLKKCKKFQKSYNFYRHNVSALQLRSRLTIKMYDLKLPRIFPFGSRTKLLESSSRRLIQNHHSLSDKFKNITGLNVSLIFRCAYRKISWFYGKMFKSLKTISNEQKIKRNGWNYSSSPLFCGKQWFPSVCKFAENTTTGSVKTPKKHAMTPVPIEK